LCQTPKVTNQPFIFLFNFSSWCVGWRFNFSAKAGEDPLKYFFFVFSFLSMCAGNVSRDVCQHQSPSSGIFPRVMTQDHLLADFW